jgi:hypothetical protein
MRTLEGRGLVQGVASPKVIIPAKAVQYAAASRVHIKAPGILDHPLSRMMTAWGVLRHDIYLMHRWGCGTKNAAPSYFVMTDLIEDVLAPTVIEHAMSIFESLKERDHAEIVQARKALTPHLFGLIASGQTDEERLLVSALIFLKSLERRDRTDKR